LVTFTGYSIIDFLMNNIPFYQFALIITIKITQ
jgi:hypothetical protein